MSGTAYMVLVFPIGLIGEPLIYSYIKIWFLNYFKIWLVSLQRPFDNSFWQIEYPSHAKLGKICRYSYLTFLHSINLRVLLIDRIELFYLKILERLRLQKNVTTHVTQNVTLSIYSMEAELRVNVAWVILTFRWVVLTFERT